MKYIFLVGALCTSITSSGQENCATLQELLALDAEIWNSGEVERLGEVFHPDCFQEGLYSGLEQRKVYARAVHEQNDGFWTRITSTICEGDVIFASFTCGGYSKEYQRELEVHGYMTARLKDGKFYELTGGISMLPALLAAGYSVTEKESIADQAREMVALNQEAWNTGNLDLLDNVYAKDYQDFQNGEVAYEGREAAKEYMRRTQEENANLQVIYGDVTCMGDKCSVEWVATGHSKKYNLDFKIHGISVSHIRDGLVYKGTTVSDILTPLLKGGYTLSPPGK